VGSYLSGCALRQIYHIILSPVCQGFDQVVDSVTKMRYNGLMANDYIILNAKRYIVQVKRYEPQEEILRHIDKALTGNTICQTFDVTDYRWVFDLTVPYTGAGDYGSLDNLKAAYAAAPVIFTDHYEHTYTTVAAGADPDTTYNSGVYFEGNLVPSPISPRIDGAAKFTVPIRLYQRVVGA